jgi:transcriptional regulator with XRE-family HTH domain
MTKEELKKIRKILGLSQTQLGEEIGYSRQQISNIERGVRGAGKRFIEAVKRMPKSHGDKFNFINQRF